MKIVTFISSIVLAVVSSPAAATRVHLYVLDNIQVNDIVFDRLANTYVVGNIRLSNTGSSFYTPVIAKYDRQGNKLWEQRYTHADSAGPVAVDNLGNVYVVGWLGSRTGSKPEVVTIKYDPNGKQIWDTNYYELFRKGVSGGPVSMAVDPNQNVYVAAQGLIIKYNTLGRLLWVAPTVDETQWASVRGISRHIALDHAGNVCVTGYIHGPDLLPDYTTAKYDPNGSLLWTAKYQGSKNLRAYATALTVDGQGSVYVTGYTTDYKDCTAITIKYGANGKEQWLARYDGAVPFAIAVHPTGSLYVAGSTGSTLKSIRTVTIKYDTNGKQQWAARHPEPLVPSCGSATYTHIGLILDRKQNVYVPGIVLKDWQIESEHSDSLIIKYNAIGTEEWAKPFSSVRQMARILNEIQIEIMK
jgi:streptogramin lyase